MTDPDALLESLRRARIVADPRKFREYVLVPGHPTGKDRIFLGTLGFRPRSGTDAWELARLYEEQARASVASGDVEFGETIEYGVPCTIIVVVRGVSVRTGWLLDDDRLRLITPFSGFARGSLEE